jgi:phage N-6-adenine-methyltransferase
MINPAMFSSESTEWETPQKLFDSLNAEFHFTLDVCATAANAKCQHFYSKEENAFRQRWRGVCWMNPPYGRTITPRWVQKAYWSSQEGALVVCLLPARTDTIWWHKYVMKGEIRFLKGRVKFTGGLYSAPFPSAVVIFREKWWEKC